MRDTIEDFNNKIGEVDLYLNFVWLLDNQRELRGLGQIPNKKIVNAETGIIERELKNLLNSSGSYGVNNELIKILKANSLLLLYNTIEGTVNNVLNVYFEKINDKSLTFDKYTPAIQ